MEGAILISMVIENADDQTFICRLYEEYEQLMFWTAAKYLNNIEDRNMKLRPDTKNSYHQVRQSKLWKVQEK